MDEDKIIHAVLDLADKVDKMRQEMLTRADGRNIQDVLAGHTGILKNIQEDHLFSVEWLKRLQETVDQQAEEIHRLKVELKLA